jgi:SynChlorMet cassette radical SAM/SPASM protein ScmF
VRVTAVATAGEKIGEARQYPLSQIYFYLTEGCNLACRHCWIAPKYQGRGKKGRGNPAPYLDFDLFTSIIAQAKPLGLSGVKLTGGEPLLHPDIRKILEHLKEQGLGVTVETNGVLCTKELARAIASCRNPFVSVSLDGVDAPTHEWVRGVPGSFKAAVRGVRNLVAAGLRPQVIMTVMRHNQDQMKAMVLLAQELRAGSVKFNIVQPTARGKKMHDAGETLSIEEIVATGRWVEEILVPASRIGIFFSHPAVFRPLGRMFGSGWGGCGVCGILSILGVLGNGSYALCGIGETVPELVFGHAAKDRLEDIWRDSPILRELREGMPMRLEGICGQCIMKGLCLGSCVAQNYYRSRNLWAGYWFCDEARERGLFPESRLAGMAGEGR